MTTVAIAKSYSDFKKYQHNVNEQLKQLKDQNTSKIKDQQQQIKNLETKLQSKAVVETPVAVAPTPAPIVAPTAPAPVTQPAVTDSPMVWVFQHESGGNQYAINASSGACGLGQSLPCSKLLASCTLGDYNCQVNFFTNYVNARYGGWQQAKNFWLQNNWY